MTMASFTKTMTSPTKKESDAREAGSFLGTGWGFPPEFSMQSRAVRMVSDDDDIRESLRILLSTNPGERVMWPAFGCGLRARVFDPLSEGMLTEIRDLVERAVLFFEPRITLDSVDIAIRDAAGGILDINLSYTVRTTNTRSNMVYPFYFLEATNARL
jgi:phage baseplate assembly protein W